MAGYIGGVSQPRFLFVRGGAIGDFIMTLPAIGAVRERWPESHIEILGYPHIIELANGRYYADATRSIEARALAQFFVSGGSLDSALVDYFGSFNVVVSYLYDPDEVFAENIRRCGVRQLITSSPRVTESPAAQHYCKPLEALALYVDKPRPRLFPSQADRDAAERFLAGYGSGRRIAVVHPGSGGEKKNWPAEKFGEICRWLMDSTSLLVIQGEADEEAGRQLVKILAGREFRWAKGLKLVELAAVLQRSAVYVGNDSGITHLAVAVGAPTVAIFGPNSSSLWHPVGERVRVVSMGTDDVAQVRRAVDEVVAA